MNFSETFIRRPVATVLLTAGIVLLGAIAYVRLPIASLPILERPIIAVRAGLPGGSSSTVAAAVTAPLEKQLGLISGLREMASTSIYGRSGILMEFDLNKNIDAAAGEVQAAIFAAGPSLPPTVQGPPVYVEANPNGFPIFAIGLTSDVYGIPEIYRFADRVLVGKLSQIEGVAKVFLSGSRKPAVRVQVNPRQLASMHASTAEVRMALQNSTLSMPLGQITEGNSAFTLTTNDQLMTASDFTDIVVKWNKDGSVKLKDVANVFDSTVNDERAGWFNDDRAVILSVMKTTNANVVETVEEIKRTIPSLEHWLPPSIHIRVLYDRTQLIRAAISDVKFTIAIAVALVVMVIALFLRRFWATVIPAVTIPVSLAATLGVMYLLDFSLDNISLMAVTIAIGFVIDDAIIIIENIIRRMHAGESPMDAALNGTRQMGFTIVSITTALMAALIPVLFMPDIPGRVFREFGLTLVVAIIASALISLTLTPMLCGQLLSAPRDERQGRFGSISAAIIDRSIDWYSRSLAWSLRFRWLALTAATALAAGSIYLYDIAPKAFLPTQDTGILRVRTVSRTNIAFEAKRDSQIAIAKVIVSDPAVMDLTSSVGKGKMSGGMFLVALKPPEVRKESIDVVAARLRDKLKAAKIEDARAIFVPVQDITLGAKRGAARYQYAVAGLNPDQVARWGLILARKIAALPQVTDVVVNYPKGGLGDNLITNRVRAASAGITITDVDAILYDWFGQEPLALIRYPSDFSRVIMEVGPEFRRKPSDLSDMFLTSGLPIDVVSVRKRDHAPLWNNHTDGIPSLTISFNTPIGVSISEAQAAIKAAEAAAHVPAEVKTEWRGEARAAQEAREFTAVAFSGGSHRYLHYPGHAV